MQRSSPSAYSTFASIRGGNTDTMRNGTLLLNPEVHPFANNSWEAVDIVAGHAERRLWVHHAHRRLRELHHEEARLRRPAYGHQRDPRAREPDQDGTIFQINAKVDNTGPINDKVAYRISVQGSDSKQYWANTEANFLDTYSAVTWKPNPRLTIDFNLSWGKSDGAVPYGTNRLTQDLIDNDVYSAGAASPILKWNGTFYRGSLDGTGFDAGTVVNGIFKPNGTKVTGTPHQRHLALDRGQSRCPQRLGHLRRE
ncbi:MAG: hypothetical protein WDM96_06930 [Lacunisphaera sp.]